jgi:hypothetical protein
MKREDRDLIKIAAAEGKIVIFPAAVLHLVTANLADAPRVTAACDFRIDEPSSQPS